jgi:hypothetical protein
MKTIRRPGAASAAVLVGLTASLVAANALAPDWSRRAGLDVWHLPALERERLTIAEERDEIDAKTERCARRREAANQIAAQLVAGAIALPTATAEIHNLYREDEGVTITLVDTYPAAPTDRLRFARHTIERAERFLREEPAPRQEAVRARLEAEYREMAAVHDSPAAP